MKKIKLLLKPKFLISFLFLLIAAIATSYAIAKNHEQKTESQALWYDDFHHSFFGKDIFAEMEEMDKRMNKIFAEHRKLMAKMIEDSDKSDKKTQGSNSLALYQDEVFYRYEMIFNSFKKEDVMVAVNDRVMTISTKNEKLENKKDKENSHSVSNFFYSITIPSDASIDPEIKREEGKITIKFKKIEQKS